jgi:hypothetical protein
MVGRYRQFRGAYRLQQPGQFMRLVAEFPANLGHSGRQAFRFEWRDQIPQPRPQIGGAELLIIGQGRKIAEESMKTAQPVRLNCRHTFACAAPLGRDLVIEKGKACIGEPQQPQTQEAGDLDGAMRILDARQRRGLARHHPPREMLEARERQVAEHEPVRPQLLQDADFLDLGFRLVGPLPDGTAPSHSRRLIPPSSIGASKRGSHISRSGPATAAMVLNRACSW